MIGLTIMVVDKKDTDTRGKYRSERLEAVLHFL